MKFLENFYSLKGKYLFGIIVCFNLLILWLSQNLLINETVFYNTYSEQLTFERSMRLFERMKDLVWINYVIYPLILLIKSTLVSIVIFTGIFLYDLHEKVSFTRIYNIVLASEVVFVSGSASRFLWLYLFGGNLDLNDMGFFYPLSIINFFDINEVAQVWIYPLQILNLFQILYIIFLSFGLRKICLLPGGVADKVVLSSYLPAIAVWITFMIFISFDTSI